MRERKVRKMMKKKVTIKIYEKEEKEKQWR